MERLAIKEGMFLKEAFQIAKNQGAHIEFILSFSGEKIRGFNLGGIKIWFPKEYRKNKADLDHEILKELILRKMDSEILQFFLIQYPTRSIISSGTIQEGMTFKEALNNTLKNNYPAYPIIEENIVRGYSLGRVPVWFPKYLRENIENLDKKTIGSMKMRKWEMENREPAFNLSTGESN